MNVVLPISLSALAAIITLVYAAYRDLVDRYIPPMTWYPMLIVGIPSVIFYYTNLGLSNGWSTVITYIVLSLTFAVLFYIIGIKHLIGGADAKALICVALCIPVFPIDTYFGTSFNSTLLGFLPFTVLSNAVTFAFCVPILIYLLNVIQGHRAPFPFMFFGFPVDSDNLPKTYGFVMEDIEEIDGVLVRKFSLRKAVFNSSGIYTKNLRLHPEQYQRELTLYRKAGTVWISYGIPFVVFITLGLVCALVLGDPLYALMRGLM